MFPFSQMGPSSDLATGLLYTRKVSPDLAGHTGAKLAELRGSLRFHSLGPYSLSLGYGPTLLCAPGRFQKTPQLQKTQEQPQCVSAGAPVK